MNYVADTHALIWWFIDSPKISAKALEIFEKCEKGENIIFIPSIVVAELLSIFDKKRISLAKYLNVPIITKDKTLQKLPSVKTIW